MKNPIAQAKQLFRENVILYLALLLGQLFFSVFVIYMIFNSQETSSFSILGLLFCPILLFFAYFISNFMNNTQQWSKHRTKSLLGKIKHNRTTMILRAAPLEAANLIFLLLALFQNQLFYLLFFCVGLILFLYFRPSTETFIKEYPLSDDELEIARALA